VTNPGRQGANLTIKFNKFKSVFQKKFLFFNHLRENNVPGTALALDSSLAHPRGPL
jgi:hypothetical protein